MSRLQCGELLQAGVQEGALEMCSLECFEVESQGGMWQGMLMSQLLCPCKESFLASVCKRYQRIVLTGTRN